LPGPAALMTNTEAIVARRVGRQIHGQCAALKGGAFPQPSHHL
jgi:hypothetical protein